MNADADIAFRVSPRTGVLGALVLLVSIPILAEEMDSARPTPAIPAIVAAFSSHRIVAIAESHALRQAGDFYAALVRDPTFPGAVNDVVIEFASRQSQPLLDRYVLEGERLAPETLSSIWRNTTKVASWESPIYARWLAAVQEVNRSLPPGRRVRVLAGDTAVDWSRMKSPSDWSALGDNNLSFEKVIEEEVLARGRKALVVLGSNHLTRGGARDGGPNTATRVEKRFPGSMYLIWLYTGRPGGDTEDARFERERWVAPALAPLTGSWVGSIGAGPRPLATMADAVLFLGPSRALTTEEAPPSSFDPVYMDELDRRSAIVWGDPTRARRFLGLPEKR